MQTGLYLLNCIESLSIDTRFVLKLNLIATMGKYRPSDAFLIEQVRAAGDLSWKKKKNDAIAFVWS